LAHLFAYNKSTIQDYEEYEKYRSYKKPSEYELVGELNGNGVHAERYLIVDIRIIQAIEKEAGPEIARAIIKNDSGPNAY